MRATAKKAGPLPDAAPYLFHEGTNFHAQDYLGAHRLPDGKHAIFRVWAPNASAVFLVSDFCGWENGLAMTRVTEGGVWELCIDSAEIPLCATYKFRILTRDGRSLYKADPYGRRMEVPPATASLLDDAPAYAWRDESWMAYRRRTMTGTDACHQPINIYELHLGSWMHHEDGSPLSYTELSHELPPYVKQMGYTHVELMPVMEHPFAGSWGYQICGYFAPTARYGTPNDFRTLVDALHEAGVGVILDWVPAHFPKDAHGLYEFDGQPLYEYQGADRMEHRGWGTRCFDVGRQEVECFLISNAVYWIEEFHADGLRVDAVASMLYLDYDRKPGEWIPNIFGDNRCLEAIAFFQKLNGYVRATHPDVLMIAEESSAFSGVTSTEGNGLGFSFKWNMGWMNDTLSYAALDPVYRKYHHEKTTFSLTYAFSERYILPISHDEVVHGKCSFLNKMPGTYEEKFAGARVFYAWQMTHPGKKLSFMGSEIGQFREWDYEGQIEWFLLSYDAHAGMQRYFSAINNFYLEHPELWERDDGWDGFTWINADDADESILSFRRRALSRAEEEPVELIVVLNFTPVTRENFRLGVPQRGVYREIFNSDDKLYGGEGRHNPSPMISEHLACDHLENSITLRLPGLSALFLTLDSKARHPEERKNRVATTARSPRKPRTSKKSGTTRQAPPRTPRPRTNAKHTGSGGTHT